MLLLTVAAEAGDDLGASTLRLASSGVMPLSVVWGFHNHLAHGKSWTVFNINLTFNLNDSSSQTTKELAVVYDALEKPERCSWEEYCDAPAALPCDRQSGG